jgi:hypothetical protein
MEAELGRQRCGALPNCPRKNWKRKGDSTERKREREIETDRVRRVRSLQGAGQAQEGH